MEVLYCLREKYSHLDVIKDKNKRRVAIKEYLRKRQLFSKETCSALSQFKVIDDNQAPDDTLTRINLVLGVRYLREEDICHIRN